MNLFGSEGANGFFSSALFWVVLSVVLLGSSVLTILMIKRRL